MASIAYRMAGDASSNFNATLMVQAHIFDTSLSILELTPNKSFGIISSARQQCGWTRLRSTYQHRKTAPLSRSFMKILARAYYELSPEQRQRQSELGRKVIKREQLW
jgi:hypothetical protein